MKRFSLIIALFFISACSGTEPSESKGSIVDESEAARLFDSGFVRLFISSDAISIKSNSNLSNLRLKLSQTKNYNNKVIQTEKGEQWALLAVTNTEPPALSPISKTAPNLLLLEATRKDVPVTYEMRDSITCLSSSEYELKLLGTEKPLGSAKYRDVFWVANPNNNNPTEAKTMCEAGNVVNEFWRQTLSGVSLTEFCSGSFDTACALKISITLDAAGYEAVKSLEIIQ